MIGTTISHYKILEKIGEGGMGVVYKAQDIQLQRLVALKFLPPHIADHPEEKARFIHEAQSASALNHPNVTTIHGIEESPVGLFIVMEYVEGKTLKQIIEEETLSMKKVLDIGIQICEGIAMAHEKGVVHRDIKSDNIMVTSRGQVKIMDFGLAKLKGATKITQTGSTLGTVSYMSPEQASGEEVDQRCDIFSFGVVLYELLTGKLPFTGEHLAAIIYSIINDEPQPIARYNNQVSAKLEEIVFKALVKDKDDRYQHIDDLLADLKRERKNLEFVKTVEAMKSTESTKPAIAVLNLQNLSVNKEDEYFAAGMTEDIITQLSKIGGLLVTSRSDVEQFKNKTISLKEVADKLRVNYVMEGSVRKYGNKIRITCQLIKASDGFHAWAESYDRQMEDLFAIQADVAKEVAQALKVALAPREVEIIEKKPTQNIEAYSYYLQAREFYFRGGYSKEGLILAIKVFKKALESDPNFALAYVGLSDCYSNFVAYAIDPKRSWLNEAEKTKLKALSLDPNLAEGHRSMSRFYWNEGKTEKAINEAEETVKINPNYGEAWRLLGVYYTWTGQYQQAEKALMRAQEVKPNEFVLLSAIINLYALWKDKSQVEEYIKRGLEIHPDNHILYTKISECYRNWGDLEDAKKMAQIALNINPQNPFSRLNLVEIFIMTGEIDNALYHVNELLKQNPDQEVYVELGYLELMRGDKKQAGIYLDSCIRFHQPLIKEFEGLPLEYYSRSRIALAYALTKEFPKALEQAEIVERRIGNALLSIEWAMDREVIQPLSFVYSLTGQKEKAMRIVEFLVKSNLKSPAYIRLHPWYKNLAGYAPFEELIKGKTKYKDDR